MTSKRILAFLLILAVIAAITTLVAAITVGVRSSGADTREPSPSSPSASAPDVKRYKLPVGEWTLLKETMGRQWAADWTTPDKLLCIRHEYWDGTSDQDWYEAGGPVLDFPKPCALHVYAPQGGELQLTLK